MSKNEILLKKPSKIDNPKIKCLTEKGIVTICYPKEFGKIEKWVHQRIGGPDIVKRPLDKYTTLIWNLCDEKHSIKDIIHELDTKFGEEIAPADKRVQLFLKKLLELNLITLK